MRTDFRLWLAAAACLLPLTGCVATSVRTHPVQSAEARLTALKPQIMRADYRADFAGLARLRDAVQPLVTDPQWGYLARYWSGFASWRTAINGASHGMPATELRVNLERAKADFEAAIDLRGDFPDAYAAASGVCSWLAGFQGGDAEAARGLLDRSRRHLERARELAPENPRVLWIEAVPYLYLPPDKGGDRARAIEIYRRMETASGVPSAKSPLPDWGKPEALMSLAYAHLNATPPDTESAEQEAKEALHLRPDWSYVKDVLLPQIERARAAKVPEKTDGDSHQRL